ncbi:ADP-ribose pyrophosphatase YjhB, NUDIX family [Paenibacillus catalpae]|uniref:ADP-ribose pyrophosphatase YjhB, NUDIX family n=1 Tax=Paenibacillus catalpae TaxID=1045775 RepID=A0A1I2EVX8_9BACL|nr:NUDIX domain-containing protein [Paenibacillus catalpae]SFE96626.1 ADP-ribose pyrophosphatase YjhB, NUDIX family [Paenibacillus catalpae]
MNSIRNSAKAIIIQDERMLLTVNKDDKGLFYICPGGGQEHSENLREAVVRECMEEIGEQVEVLDLVHVREYIGRNYDGGDPGTHQVEFYFECNLVSSSPTFENVSVPDHYQIGIDWVDINRLDEVRFYPKELGMRIKNKEGSIRYLGDVN